MNNVKRADTWPASTDLISVHERMVPGRIGNVELLSGCYTFWECVQLMAEDIARRGLARQVRAALDTGKTVRQLMKEFYGVHPPAPTDSDRTPPGLEARALRRRIRYAETDQRRASRLSSHTRTKSAATRRPKTRKPGLAKKVEIYFRAKNPR